MKHIKPLNKIILILVIISGMAVTIVAANEESAPKGTTYYLDAAAVDGGDGSESAPFNDLRTAIHGLNDAGDNMTLVIRSGDYVAGSPTGDPFLDNGIIVTGNNVTIKGEGHPQIDLGTARFVTRNDHGSYMEISGLNLTGTGENLIYHALGELRLKNNILKGGQYSTVESPCMSLAQQCSLLYMSNNVIVGNGTGTGVYARPPGDRSFYNRPVTLINNTIIGHKVGVEFYAVALQPTTFQNNIIIDSEIGTKDNFDHTQTYGGNLIWDYNLFGNIQNYFSYYSDTHSEGGLTDLVEIDPMLDPITYRPMAGSPAINAGSPDAGFNDPDGSRNDLGAFGGPNAEVNTIKVSLAVPELSADSAVTVTIQLENIGIIDFSDVGINLQMTGTVTLLEASPTATISENTVTFQPFSISAGQTQALTVVVDTPESGQGLVQGVLSASWGTGSRTIEFLRIIDPQLIYLPVIQR